MGGRCRQTRQRASPRRRGISDSNPCEYVRREGAVRGRLSSLTPDLGLDESNSAGARCSSNLSAGLKASLKEALTRPQPTTETDLFGAVERFLSRKGDRAIVAVIFSDMLHSTRRDIDMEHLRLSETGIGLLIQKIGQARRWHSGMLDGTRVICVLPVPTVEKSRPDTKMLELFWSTLFRSLGAELVRWDSQESNSSSKGRTHQSSDQLSKYGYSSQLDLRYGEWKRCPQASSPWLVSLEPSMGLRARRITLPYYRTRACGMRQKVCSGLDLVPSAWHRRRKRLKTSSAMPTPGQKHRVSDSLQLGLLGSPR